MANKYLDDFMKAFPYDGLTFDDVSLLTLYSDMLPGETSVCSVLSRNIKLNVPFISAAMDTVTESEMAIAMSRLGGLGVIHKNLTISRQADEVRNVRIT
jgi:IMP dehydrogenase